MVGASSNEYLKPYFAKKDGFEELTNMSRLISF